MSAFMAQEDDDYHQAGLEAYNTWLNDEFTAADHSRFVSLAQMPAVDIATSVRWLREAKAAGFKGVIISAYPSGNPTLSAEDDPFWEAAQEEGMPIHIHVGLPRPASGGRRPAGSRPKAVRSVGPRAGRDGRPRRRRLRVHEPVHLLGHASTGSPT